VGAGFHFAGVVVRDVGADGMADQLGFDRAWSLSIAWVMTSVQGHRAVKRRQWWRPVFTSWTATENMLRRSFLGSSGGLCRSGEQGRPGEEVEVEVEGDDLQTDPPLGQSRLRSSPCCGTGKPGLAGFLGMNSDGRWRTLDSQVLFTGGPHDRIHLTVDQAVRPDGAVVAHRHVSAPDSSEYRPVILNYRPVIANRPESNVHSLHDRTLVRQWSLTTRRVER
jgi:hypothetical protein